MTGFTFTQVFFYSVTLIREIAL